MITNATEYPYSLSIHASNMLLAGIIEYHRTTRSLYRKGLEDCSYSSMRTWTALKEARRLLAHLDSIDDLSPLCRLAKPAKEDLTWLLRRLEKDKKKFSDAEHALYGN